MAPLRESCLSSVEATEHDAEAPLHGDLVEHFRRRSASSEDGADHSRLVPGVALRNASLEQLHDLPGRPGVDVRKGAFADLLPRDPRMARPPEPCQHTAQSSCAVKFVPLASALQRLRQLCEGIADEVWALFNRRS
jgi:hypothetical protein